MMKNSLKKSVVMMASVCMACTLLTACGGVNITFNGSGSDATTEAEAFSDEMISDTVKIEDSFDSITADIILGEVTFKQGDEMSVSYSLPESFVPEIKCEDGTLNISNPDSSYSDDLSSLSSESNIVITLPKDMTLEELDITLSWGDVELDNMNIKDLYVNQAMGNLKVTDSTIESADAHMAMGDCDISGSINGLTADVALGNLNLTSDVPVDDMDLSLDCSLGTCTVNGEDYSNN